MSDNKKHVYNTKKPKNVIVTEVVNPIKKERKTMFNKKKQGVAEVTPENARAHNLGLVEKALGITGIASRVRNNDRIDKAMRHIAEEDYESALVIFQCDCTTGNQCLLAAICNEIQLPKV